MINSQWCITGFIREIYWPLLWYKYIDTRPVGNKKTPVNHITSTTVLIAWAPVRYNQYFYTCRNPSGKVQSEGMKAASGLLFPSVGEGYTYPIGGLCRQAFIMTCAPFPLCLGTDREYCIICLSQNGLIHTSMWWESQSAAWHTDSGRNSGLIYLIRLACWDLRMLFEGNWNTIAWNTMELLVGLLGCMASIGEGRNPNSPHSSGVAKPGAGTAPRCVHNSVV